MLILIKQSISTFLVENPFTKIVISDTSLCNLGDCDQMLLLVCNHGDCDQVVLLSVYNHTDSDQVML